MDFQFPGTRISITLYSMLIAIVIIILCIILRKKSISSVKHGTAAIGVVGLIISCMMCSNNTAGGEVNYWLGSGPALLIMGFFGTSIGLYKPLTSKIILDNIQFKEIINLLLYIHANNTTLGLRSNAMPTILPISDLRNYTEVLNQVDIDKAVYLTRNGRGSYVITKIDDYDPEIARADLMREIELGIASMNNEASVDLEKVAKKYNVSI